MPNKILIFGITVLAVVIIVGGLSWTLYINSQSTPAQNPPSNGSPEPESQNPEDNPPELPATTPSDDNETSITPSSPELFLQEQIRDIAMSFVKTKYPETAPLMVNLTWTGGRYEAGSPDNETYLYYTPEWDVKVEYPATSDPTYTITGNYNSASTFVTFTAVYKNGIVNIINYQKP